MSALDPSPGPAPSRSGPQHSRVVLVGVDGSTTSLRAATYACGLARRERCRLVVAHVVPVGGWEWAMVGAGAGAVLQQLREELTAELKAEIRALTEGCPGPVTFVSLVGNQPTHGLTAIADEIRADIVVVGASRGWRRWCGTSVATRLIRLSRWPVIVIP
jgi:nucleotide-binding universal stress UspA family protein